MTSIAQLPAVLQHQDMVGMENRTDALGDDDGGHAAVLLPQSLAEQGVGLIVQRAGGIVENQDFGAACQGPCHQQALLLAAAEVGSLGSEHVGEAVRQGGDEFHGLRAAGSFFDLLPRQMPAEINVFINRIGKKHVVLKYYAEFRV